MKNDKKGHKSNTFLILLEFKDAVALREKSLNKLIVSSE